MALFQQSTISDYQNILSIHPILINEFWPFQFDIIWSVLGKVRAQIHLFIFVRKKKTKNITSSMYFFFVCRHFKGPRLMKSQVPTISEPTPITFHFHFHHYSSPHVSTTEKMGSLLSQIQAQTTPYLSAPQKLFKLL